MTPVPLPKADIEQTNYFADIDFDFGDGRDLLTLRYEGSCYGKDLERVKEVARRCDNYSALVAQLFSCASIFENYAQQHYKKCTAEGDEKGDRNMAYAEKIRLLILAKELVR